MLPEPVDLGNTDSVSQNFVNFVLVHQLRLTDGNGLFFGNTCGLLLLGGLDQVLNLHCELVITFFKCALVLAILFSDHINT